MTMLSRVAERLFWMARYLERSEDTARLTNAFSHLLMDLPESSDVDWDLLVEIYDAEALFASRPRSASEQNVLRFLLADASNPSSILSSVCNARENVRTTRDALPAETWEYMNELHLFAQEHAEKSVGRRNRYFFLEQVTSRCQQINGLLMTTLSRDHAYRFIKLGQLLERADMTTRIIDIGAGVMLSHAESQTDYQAMASAHIWTSLLRALSSLSSYREYIGPTVDTQSAVNFVFKESSHPRSVIFCLRGIRDELGALNNSTIPIAIVEQTIDMLMAYSMRETRVEALHRFVDQLQGQLCDINDVIAENWFSRLSDNR